MKNHALYRSLHRRGLTQAEIAAAVRSSRSHVSEVLANQPGHGHQTRKKIAPMLTPAELRLLGWSSTGNILA